MAATYEQIEELTTALNAMCTYRVAVRRQLRTIKNVTHEIGIGDEVRELLADLEAADQATLMPFRALGKVADQALIDYHDRMAT
jgi:transcription elongation factor